MHEEIAAYFFIVFLVFFGIIWFGFTRFLRNKANMSLPIEVDVGSPISTTDWATGAVNGVLMKGCLRVVSYNKGFVLEARKIFGGGKIWLPKEKIVLGKMTQNTLFKRQELEFISENNKVSLYGKLGAAIII